MAYGDGGIAILLLHHKLSHRLAYNVGASEHHTFLATCLYAVELQQCYDAQRRCRDEAWQTDGHPAYVDRMEAVDILAVVDGHDNLLLVDMAWQRQLHDEAINVGIVVEPFHAGKKLLLSNVILVAYEGGLEAALLAGNNLVLDIRLASSVVANKDSSKMWLLASIGNYVAYLLRYLRLDGCCGSLSVY